MNNRTQHIINWLCGKEKKLNLLQNLPKVPDVIMPKVFKRIRKIEEKYEHTPIESDILKQGENE